MVFIIDSNKYKTNIQTQAITFEQYTDFLGKKQHNYANTVKDSRGFFSLSIQKFHCLSSRIGLPQTEK